jgi:hypothetical protein
MKKTLLIVLLLLASRCTEKKNESSSQEVAPVKSEVTIPPLYINTLTYIGDNDPLDSITVVNGAYFEVGLYSSTKKDGSKTWTAQKDLEKSSLGEPYRSVSFHIGDAHGKVVVFNSTTEFLNYMDERGYTMATQSIEKYHTDYTFKKK